MAKKVSVILIIAACCVGLGIALLAVSSAFWGGSPRNWYDSPQTLTERFDDVSDLNIAVANSNIELRRGGDTFTVEWEERYPSEYDINASGGRLEIEQSSERRWGWGWFNFDLSLLRQWRGFDAAPTRITVTVPEDAELRSVDVALANGSVLCENFACEDFSLAAANGTVQGTLDAPDIELGGANLMGVELTVPEGTLEDTRISMDGVNGRLRVNGETVGRGVLNSVETGSGSRRISVSMVNGSVDVTDN
jgi:hypothetical protein